MQTQKGKEHSVTKQAHTNMTYRAREGEGAVGAMAAMITEAQRRTLRRKRSTREDEEAKGDRVRETDTRGASNLIERALLRQPRCRLTAQQLAGEGTFAVRAMAAKRLASKEFGPCLFFE